MREPNVSVCIKEAAEVCLTLHGNYMAKGITVTGQLVAEYRDGAVSWNGNIYQELMLSPFDQQCHAAVHDVKIGINFHWERNQTQVFQGELKLIPNDGKICVVNILPVEQYLKSVISSEMKATSSREFLKSHAVISRSWLIAQMEKREKLSKAMTDNAFFSFRKTDHSMIRWYDREDHILFDVCADDHCQRYQGIVNAENDAVLRAVSDTHGQVLTYNNQICDARFSKCCGGAMERFSSCWEDWDMPYLSAKRDWIENVGSTATDLTNEENVRQWIMSSPEAFCNTSNHHVLAQILNAYDLETESFYRWRVEYSHERLAELVASNMKMDFGQITDLIPVQRGPSGRIVQLKIVGTKKTFVIGKELEIRRVLSESHLKSSAFVVEKTSQSFILHGAGWGHGVGLCQIGAAVMGENGYSYLDILHHYYPGASVTPIYQ